MVVDRLTVPGVGLVAVERYDQPAADLPRTAQTVFRMRLAMGKGAADPLVVAAAREAIAGAATVPDQVEAVFRWIQRHVRFVDDPEDDELLIEPSVLLRLPRDKWAGDCDDFTMLGGAMLGALGIPARIVTIKADPKDPLRFSHVYLEVDLPDGRRLAFDSSHGSHVGWAAPRNFGAHSWGGPMLMPSAALGWLGQDDVYGGEYNFPGTDAGSASPTASAGSNAILNAVLQTGRDFASAFAFRLKYPPGTVLQTPTGTFARGPESVPVGVLPAVSLGAGGQILPWVLIIGGIIIVAAVAKGRG